MKASSATSAKAIEAPPPTGPSSARLPSPTRAESFALTGPSQRPDPTTHAYRRDLADIALAGSVIASHYAAAVDRVLGGAETLRALPDGAALGTLEEGDRFELLDERLGWAWGYAGPQRRVGYVPADALTTP